MLTQTRLPRLPRLPRLVQLRGTVLAQTRLAQSRDTRLLSCLLLVSGRVTLVLGSASGSGSGSGMGWTDGICINTAEV